MFNGTFTSLELDTEVEELVSILQGVFSIIPGMVAWSRCP